MAINDYFLHLFDYHQWANEEITQHLKKMPKDLLNHQVTSVFPSIAETIGHIIVADETWFLRMQGKADHIRTIKAKSFSKIEDIEKESRALYLELRNYLLHTNIEAEVQYRNTKGEKFTNRICEIIQHMVNHGTYHRGNIASMIRQMGYEGIATDYIKYVRTP